MSAEKTIEELKKELSQLNEKLADPSISNSSKKYQELSKKHGKIKNKIEFKQKKQEIEEQISENKQLLNQEEEESELYSLAQEELKNLKENKENLIQEHKDKQDEKNKTKSAVIEIRAGTGGEEAALFAKDLFRMYTEYAQKQGWKENILERKETSLGGYKRIEFEIEGKGVFDQLKMESGVHRVQRVPETEKSGRIHTSTATVAVLPQYEQPEGIKLKDSNLRVDTYRASGKGGQHVNRRETAVRITHEPTGIVTSCQDERSQHKNKSRAKEILKNKLLYHKRKQNKKEVEELREDQIGQAERAEKIRTYNFPQNRITDHRLEENWHNLENIIEEGKIKPIIESLQEYEQEED